MMTKREMVLILGVGHAACGTDADFEAGKKRSTTLWAADSHDRTLPKIKRQGSLPSYLELNGTFNLEITKDLEYGFGRACLVVVTTPCNRRGRYYRYRREAYGRESPRK